MTKRKVMSVTYSIRELTAIRRALSEGFVAVWKGKTCVLTKIVRVPCSLWGWLCG